MKFVKYFFLLLVVLVAIVLFRTWRFVPAPHARKASIEKITMNVDKDAAIQRFGKALSFQTISYAKAGEDYGPQFEAFHVFLKQSFPNVFSQFKVQTVGKHGMLLIWQGSDASQRPILFMAHQDVVPIAPGTEDRWEQPPFSSNVVDGYVWGRGAIDDKASLMALLETAEIMLGGNLQPKRTLYFYFGDDEEIGGKTAGETSKLLQQQGVQFAYVIDEGGLISKGILPVEKKVAVISIAEKGYVDVELSTEAQGGHSSMPPKITAIGTLSRAISVLRDNLFPTHYDGVTAEMFDNISRHMPFGKRMAFANLWLFKPFVIYWLEQRPITNALLRTTTAPTIFNAGVKPNVLPVKASATINLRIIPGETVESVVNHIKATINNSAIKVTPMLSSNPSPVSDKNGPGFKLLQSAIFDAFGDDLILTPWIVVGATDSRHFIPIADNVYRFMPVILDKTDLARFHGTNERLSVTNYLQMIQFYYRIFRAS